MTLVAKRGDIHRSKPVKWMWSGKIIRNNLNLIVGNEGVGKGTLVAWMLAKLTKGTLKGSMWGTRCNVAIIGTEDDFNDVWTPRVFACGGDVDRLVSIEREDFDQVDIHRDIESLAELVQEEEVSLLYFDQFLDNLATDTDHYHAKQVRSAVAPLRTVAKELGVTTIATMHPNKKAENFRQLVQGTSAFNAMARSSLYIAQHPTKADSRVVVTAKSNHSKIGDSMEFKIAEWSDRPNGYRLVHPKVVGLKESSITLDELIAGAKAPKPETKQGACAKVIHRLLEDGEWHESRDIYEVCEQEGYYERQARRAAKLLGVEMKKSKNFKASVLWKLPTSRTR